MVGESEVLTRKSRPQGSSLGAVCFSGAAVVVHLANLRRINRRETGAAFDKAEELCRTIETPTAIVMTERDRQLGLFAGNARVGATYARDDVPALRALVRANDIDGVVSAEVWKRASEILEALRTLGEDEEREELKSGMAEAKRAYYPAADVLDDLVERLAKTPASTIEGVLAKAGVMRRTFLGDREDFTEGFNDNLRRRMRRMGPDQEACALSLARDLIQLAAMEGAR